ncbi:putative nitrogen fixation protein [Fontibacillus solani]|uniref:Putative nitrogen fixation protein n=1 Tax=Fontibacillus solani TaxID=1572857 RepID=A0A7W3XUI5_9BACL|nr:DUF269 domain-containing protein [Fontibacillus solani]MBA9088745.1 putative nitrogen fixation protein [Fontibacillus solani]
MSEAEAYQDVQDEQEQGPLYRAAKGGCAEVEAERLVSTFNKSLSRILDAYDYFEKGSGLNTEEKIARLALFTAEEKLALGADCTPSPKLRKQVENVFQAMALTLEIETNSLVQSMVDMNSEGFGRAIVSSGRLILISTTLRAGLRFPFSSRIKLERFALNSLREALEWHSKHSEITAKR